MFFQPFEAVVAVLGGTIFVHSYAESLCLLNPLCGFAHASVSNSQIGVGPFSASRLCVGKEK